MTDQAHSTLPREAKGPLAPPPALKGELQAVAEAVGAWPEVTATTHWRFADQSRVDGVDFYVGGEELGHLHLDGSIHLATTPALMAELVAEGSGTPFRYARGWTQAGVNRLGVAGAVALLRRNYDRLRAASSLAAQALEADDGEPVGGPPCRFLRPSRLAAVSAV